MQALQWMGSGHFVSTNPPIKLIGPSKGRVFRFIPEPKQPVDKRSTQRDIETRLKPYGSPGAIREEPILSTGVPIIISIPICNLDQGSFVEKTKEIPIHSLLNRLKNRVEGHLPIIAGRPPWNIPIGDQRRLLMSVLVAPISIRASRIVIRLRGAIREFAVLTTGVPRGKLPRAVLSDDQKIQRPP